MPQLTPDNAGIPNQQRKGKRKARRKRNRQTRKGELPASKLSTGGRIGSKIGEFLGNYAEKGLGRLFGRGEYRASLGAEIGHDPETIVESSEPEVNSLVKPLSSRDLVPLMGMNEEGTVTITRREFIDTIDIASTDKSAAYQINPGFSMFPWLSSVAKAWQQYRILGLAFEYVPTSGYAVSSESAALGQVVMAFKYNVLENVAGWPRANLRAMLNQNGSVSMSPAAPGTCYLECKDHMVNQPCKYIYNEQVPTNPFSQQNYEAATLLIFTSGAQADAAFQCGQIWVTYQIQLFQPRVFDATLSLDGLPQDIREVLRELNYLLNFTALVTDTERIRLDARLREIKSYVASFPFQRRYAEAMMKQQLEECKEEEELHPLPACIQRLLDNPSRAEEIITPAPPLLVSQGENRGTWVVEPSPGYPKLPSQ